MFNNNNTQTNETNKRLICQNANINFFFLHNNNHRNCLSTCQLFFLKQQTFVYCLKKKQPKRVLF